MSRNRTRSAPAAFVLFRFKPELPPWLLHDHRVQFRGDFGHALLDARPNVGGRAQLVCGHTREQRPRLLHETLKLPIVRHVAEFERAQEFEQLRHSRFLELQWFAFRAVFQPVPHVRHEFSHGHAQHLLDLLGSLGHHLGGLLPLALPDSSRDLPKLLWNAKAHVLPREAELPADVLDWRIVLRTNAPEPGTLALFGAGLVCLGLTWRRKHHAASAPAGGSACPT